MNLRITVVFLLLSCLGCAGSVKPPVPTFSVGPIQDQLVYDTPPALVSSERLEYPDMARQVGAEGRVLLKVLVLENGTIGAVEVLESPHEMLTDNALKAVAACVFTPAMSEGVPVRATVVMPFVFSLNQSYKRTSVSSEPKGQPSPGAIEQEPPRPVEPPEPRDTKQKR